MALRRPKTLQPHNGMADLKDGTNFTCVVDGDIITNYNVKIYNNNDNAQLWTSGNQTLGTPVDIGETLTMPIPNAATTGIDSATNQELYWTVEYSADNGSTWSVSTHTFFLYVQDPDMTITVPAIVTSQKHNFVCQYTQADNFRFEKWYLEIYDASGAVIEKTEESKSSKIEHEFTGFITGNSYSVKVFCVLEYNTLFSSQLYAFNVLFDIPEVLIQPEVTQSADTASVKITWGGIIQQNGVLSAGSASYVDDFMVSGNKGYDMGVGSHVTFGDLVIPENSTIGHVRKFDDNTYDGYISEVSHSVTGDSLIIGRDYAKNWFYKIINGAKVSGEIFGIDSSKLYTFANVGNDVYVGEYDLGFNLLRYTKF